MKRIKTGNWLYVYSNETIKFVGNGCKGYEIDLERKTCCQEWLQHLDGKIWINPKDIDDLWTVFQEVQKIKSELPIFN
jgi:hypothetical protein